MCIRDRTYLSSIHISCKKRYNAKKVIKYDGYHAEAARRNALLLFFIIDSNGSFTPTDKLFKPGINNRQQPKGAGIDPRLGLHAVFENGVVPQVGQLEVSIEEGLIRKLSRRVTADMGSGCKLLDMLRSPKTLLSLKSERVKRCAASRS